MSNCEHRSVNGVVLESKRLVFEVPSLVHFACADCHERWEGVHGVDLGRHDEPRTPDSYRSASWRCALPIDGPVSRLGLVFTHDDGSVSRLSIDRGDARQLMASIAQCLGERGVLQ